MAVCIKKTGVKSDYDPRSFRRKKTSKGSVLLACPRGKWSPRARAGTGGCRVSMKAYEIVKKARSCTDGYVPKSPKSSKSLGALGCDEKLYCECPGGGFFTRRKNKTGESLAGLFGVFGCRAVP